MGIIGLQECRIPSGMDGCEGEYRTHYSGNVDGKRQHGVGIFMHNTVTQGEFDIQPINERIMWIYGMVFGVMQAVFAVYAPTNKKDNIGEVDKFYSTLEQQVKEVRTKYGVETKIIILGDFNARIGTDGADNATEECNDNNEPCANGMFGFEEVDDNGAELLTFCVAQQLKVMDSYFERRDGEYGTWACNRSKDKGFHAILDHILVSRELWGEVITCGVHIPAVRWNTDHRMVELDLGKYGKDREADVATEGHTKDKKSEQAKERSARRNFNKHILWCRLNMDPEQELPRMRDTLERMVATAKAAMLDNIEVDPEWEKHTQLNADAALHLLNDALSATAEELFPGGVPANNQMKGRHWNSKNRELAKLVIERGKMMRQLRAGRDESAATAAKIHKLEEKVQRKQRQIRENLRRNRDEYWTKVAEQLERAYRSKDMKLYYKLIIEAHGPQLTSTSKGRQSITGQHMKLKTGNDRTRTKTELETRWIEHFTELFNQPGILGEGIDRCLPAQRAINDKIKTGPFDMAELHAAIRDMNNDKAAGLDGWYGIEMEKYIAGEAYLNIELTMFNEILESGDMPAILRDVIITILYKGKGQRDKCDNYRGISLMSHKG